MATKRDAFNKILANAMKKHDLNIGPMSSITSNARFVSTGNFAIDYVTGGGIPLGRVTELAGTAGSGKTTTALQAAAELQRIIINGGDEARGISDDDVIMYFDYESAMDPSYAKALKLDIDHHTFQFGQPTSLEEGANLALEVAETGLVRMMIFDSVPAMMPDALKVKDIGEHSVAVRAKLMTDFIARLAPLAAEHNVAVVLINHIKDMIGINSRPGMPPIRSTPGGVALKYYASVRLEYDQRKHYKSKVFDPILNEYEEKVTANDVRIKCVKNKLAPPYREQMVRVRYGKGFDKFYTAITALVAHKRIMTSTGIYYFHKMEDIGGAPEWMNRATTGTKRPYIKGLDNLNNAGEQDLEWANILIAEAEKIVFQELPVLNDDEDEEEFEVEEVNSDLSASKPPAKPNVVSL